MKIIVTNDDGIFAPGLQALVEELKGIAQVTVVAPDREQSATGTAVTLRLPLRVQRMASVFAGVDTYSVEGTPCDSVILALGKLTKDRAHLLISGINKGLNLGDDVLISGTVAAAMQGYLRGLPAIAISAADTEECHLKYAARLAALLAQRIQYQTLPADLFLNINLPGRPLSRIKGIKITQPAHRTHIDTVEEGHDGKREYYWLVRQKSKNSADAATDIGAVEQGNISITALHTTLFQKPSPAINDRLASQLLHELKQTQAGH